MLTAHVHEALTVDDPSPLFFRGSWLLAPPSSCAAEQPRRHTGLIAGRDVFSLLKA